MECPVCRQSADGAPSANADAKIVRCEACGTFDISVTAEAALSNLDEHHRIQALRYAQTNALAGRFPYIHGVA